MLSIIRLSSDIWSIIFLIVTQSRQTIILSSLYCVLLFCWPLLFHIFPLYPILFRVLSHIPLVLTATAYQMYADIECLHILRYSVRVSRFMQRKVYLSISVARHAKKLISSPFPENNIVSQPESLYTSTRDHVIWEVVLLEELRINFGEVARKR